LRPGHNAISLTGAAHRLDSYLALPEGWREPPPGTWSDHYMWQQWFRVPELRFSTGDRITVLKFFAVERTDMTGAERRSELMDWLERSTEPGFASTLDARAGIAVRREAIRFAYELEAVSDELVETKQSLEQTDAERTAVRGALEAVQGDLDDVRRELKDVRAQLEAEEGFSAAHAADAEAARAAARDLQATLDAVRATRTWRLHDRLARSSLLRRLARG
jgi:hypothetical protein